MVIDNDVDFWKIPQSYMEMLDGFIFNIMNFYKDELCTFLSDSDS